MELETMLEDAGITPEEYDALIESTSEEVQEAAEEMDALSQAAEKLQEEITEGQGELTETRPEDETLTLINQDGSASSEMLTEMPKDNTAKDETLTRGEKMNQDDAASLNGLTDSFAPSAPETPETGENPEKIPAAQFIRDLQGLMTRHPELKDRAEPLSQALVEAYFETGSMETAYLTAENLRQAQAIEALQAELSILRQNQAAYQLSPIRKGVANTGPRPGGSDPITAGFDEAYW